MKRQSHVEYYQCEREGVLMSFNVSAARALLAAKPRAQRRVAVAPLHEATTEGAAIHEGHLAHVDMSDPVFLALVHDQELGDDVAYLIDGLHRVERAQREGRDYIEAFFFEAIESSQLLIPPEVASMLAALDAPNGMQSL
jgi:hypothetical protein